MAGKSQRFQQRIARTLNLNPNQFVLGDGQGRVYGDKGMVYVRQRLGADGDGAPVFGAPIQVRSNPSANYYTFNGAAVTLENKGGIVQVGGTTWEGAISQGLDPNVLNPANVFTQQNRVTNIAAPHIDPDTQFVGANQLFYVDTLGQYQVFDITAAQMLDLTAYEPAGAGEQRLVLTYIGLDNELHVTQSTPKPIAQLFDFDDIGECVDLLPPTAIPLGAWRVRNGQTAWTQSDLIIDLRQWINAPNNITRAATSPTVTDDDTDGFIAGGVWINTTTDAVFMCVDNTTSAAVWRNLTASGGSVAWGDITGTLSAQTDLQTALNAKLTADGVANSVEISSGNVQLVGDSASPGNSRYYGTNSSGTKGYHVLTSGGGVQVTQGATDINPASQIVIGTGLTLSEPSAGVAEIVGTGGGGASYPEQWHMHHHAATVISGSVLSSAAFNIFEYRGYWFQNPSADGDEFRQGVFLRDGLYTLFVMGLRGNNRGILDWLIGASVVGSQDWYAGSNIPAILTITGVTVPTSGWHTLTGKTNGKNASSSNFFQLPVTYWMVRTGDLP